MAWLAVAALIFGLDAAGIPYAYARYESVCTSAACDDVDWLTPHHLQALHDLGHSAGFWRGSNDRMALFASFTLLVFGGAALGSSLSQALAAAHPRQ